MSPDLLLCRYSVLAGAVAEVASTAPSPGTRRTVSGRSRPRGYQADWHLGRRRTCGRLRLRRRNAKD
jgi:hypothetical protein